MTLKKGEQYRGIWAGIPGWLRITKILVNDSQVGIIYYTANYQKLPKYLWWVGAHTSDDATSFISRIDRAAEMDKVEAEKLKYSSSFREVSEVEVRYR